MNAHKVLVVDDSTSVRQQVCSALAGHYDVLEAVDGVDGLDMVARNGGQLCIILCDVNMPRMNGLEMMNHVRGLPGATGIPVVMLTTEGQPALIQRAKQAGARGWIIKPFKPDLLLSAVRKVATRAAVAA